MVNILQFYFHCHILGLKFFYTLSFQKCSIAFYLSLLVSNFLVCMLMFCLLCFIFSQFICSLAVFSISTKRFLISILFFQLMQCHLHCINCHNCYHLECYTLPYWFTPPPPREIDWFISVVLQGRIAKQTILLVFINNFYDCLFGIPF